MLVQVSDAEPSEQHVSLMVERAFPPLLPLLLGRGDALVLERLQPEHLQHRGHGGDRHVLLREAFVYALRRVPIDAPEDAVAVCRRSSVAEVAHLMRYRIVVHDGMWDVEECQSAWEAWVHG